MSTNPTHLEQLNQTEQQNKAPRIFICTHSGFTLVGRLAAASCDAWRAETKARHHSFRQVLARVPHANLIGDAVVTIGFWVEYAVVCAVRGTYKVASAIGMNAARLLVAIIRPRFSASLPCARISSSNSRWLFRHTPFPRTSDELSDESAHTIRKEKPVTCPCRTAIFAAAERAFLHYAGCCGGRLFAWCRAG